MPTPETPDTPTPRRVAFVATIPPSESAIRIHGETGARLTLDIAESDILDFLRVLPLRGHILNVTLEIREDRS